VSLESVESWLSQDGEGFSWELFHENSKLSMHERHLTFAHHPSDATVVAMMRQLRRVRPYEDYPKVALPEELPVARAPFDDVVLRRVSARAFADQEITFAELAKILQTATAVTRPNKDTGYPNPFRTVPSGGALYPLELYVHARRVTNLEPGLYHLDPEDREFDVLRAGDQSDRLAGLLIQQELEAACAASVFVTAIPYRSVFKYGDRGYRFALLEAGHLVQNLCLAATALELASTPIGGYADRGIDRWLGLDGLTQSTVYAALLGHEPDPLRSLPSQPR
jgi:SagB-type dehydrogenase family enzyme